jgi:hypothetical protein
VISSLGLLITSVSFFKCRILNDLSTSNFPYDFALRQYHEVVIYSIQEVSDVLFRHMLNEEDISLDLYCLVFSLYSPSMYVWGQTDRGWSQERIDYSNVLTELS